MHTASCLANQQNDHEHCCQHQEASVLWVLTGHHMSKRLSCVRAQVHCLLPEGAWCLKILVSWASFVKKSVVLPPPPIATLFRTYESHSWAFFIYTELDQSGVLTKSRVFCTCKNLHRWSSLYPPTLWPGIRNFNLWNPTRNTVFVLTLHFEELCYYLILVECGLLFLCCISHSTTAVM